MALDRRGFSVISMSHSVIAAEPRVLFALFWQLLRQDEVQLISFDLNLIHSRTRNSCSNYA